MKRLVFLLLCTTAFAAEPDKDEKGPLLRLTPTEAAVCASNEGCKVVTNIALREFGIQAYRAGYLKAVADAIRKETRCGRDA